MDLHTAEMVEAETGSLTFFFFFCKKAKERTLQEAHPQLSFPSMLTQAI